MSSKVAYSRLFGKQMRWKDPSFLARLPEHYYNHLMEMKKAETRVHDVPRTGQLLDYQLVDPETLRIERVVDHPVDVRYPRETHEGLWSGEGIVRGFIKTRDFFGKFTSKLWFPTLHQTIFYSEILDTYLRVTVTERTMRLVDQMCGFDNYILKTPIQDFKTSQLGLDLRRKMLVTLAKGDYHLTDENKRKYVSEKYKEHVMPLEEAEWIGLPISRATTKLKIIEAKKYQPQPLYNKYAAELVQKLRNNEEIYEED